MEFQYVNAGTGCGTLATDDGLGYAGGGSKVNGRQMRFVYGVVLPPVASVRVTYERGPVVELEPAALPGFDEKFFAHVTEAPAGFTVEALDGDEKVLVEK